MFDQVNNIAIIIRKCWLGNEEGIERVSAFCCMNFRIKNAKIFTVKIIANAREKINLILAAATGQPMERIATDTERDFFLDAQGAVDYGIVDEVLTKNPTGTDSAGANQGGSLDHGDKKAAG